MSQRDDFLADVLAHIEDHLFEPLTLGELAAVVGFSPYHFSRAFTARLGVSVMDHVRSRRLERAYMRLAGSEPPNLIDLAFDCGFESQEAFSRAFKRRYGVAPGQFRRAAHTAHLQPERREAPMANAKSHVTREADMRREAFSVAGPRASFDNENKSGIPALWPRLVRALPLEGQVGANTYGVVWGVDQRLGLFNYMAAVQVGEDAPLPEGFERLHLDAHTYAVFRIHLDGSNLHAQMQAAMPVVWGEMLPRAGVKLAGAPDFEFYPENFNPEVQGMHVDMCIPIES